MNILNGSVKHIKFGDGIITEAKDNKIWVEFEGKIGTKAFIYPDAFEKFLKIEDLEAENSILKELHIKQEQLRLEMERKQREREAAEEKERMERLELVKKKSATKTRKKKY